MAKGHRTEKTFVLLGSRKGLFEGSLPPHVSVCHDRLQIAAVASRPSKVTTWISFNRTSTDLLLESAVDIHAGFRGSQNS